MKVKEEVVLKAKVKKDTCIGCGACTTIADQIFQIGDDGLAEVINPTEAEKVQEIPEEERENVMDAAESCPTGAIEVIE